MHLGSKDHEGSTSSETTPAYEERDELKSAFADLSHSGIQSLGSSYGTSKSGRPELKRYRQYTRHDITAAIDAVRTGMSALQASRLYGVPSRTLYDKVSSK